MQIREPRELASGDRFTIAGIEFVFKPFTPAVVISEADAGGSLRMETIDVGQMVDRWDVPTPAPGGSSATIGLGSTGMLGARPGLDGPESRLSGLMAKPGTGGKSAVAAALVDDGVAVGAVARPRTPAAGVVVPAGGAADPLALAGQIVGLFSRVAESLVQAKDRGELFESVVQVIHGSIPADNVCLCLLNEQGQAMPVAVQRRNADAATPMTISRSVTGEVLANNRAVLVTDASASGSATLTDLKIRSVLCVPVYHNGKTSGLIYADSLSIDQIFNKQHLELLAALALLAAVGFEQFAMREDAQRKRQMIDRLGRYVEGPVVDRLMNMKHGDAPLEEMQAEERELTVMFADVCGFTSMSEQMQPREVADVLNEIFGKLTEAVFRFQGTVDKFLGDGILAFSAPRSSWKTTP